LEKRLPEAFTAERERALVWDAPIRVVHASFIACVAGAWLTRAARHSDLHAAFGYCALGLVAFRILWGVVGPRHARFAAFAYSPRDTIDYLRRALAGVPRHYTGHNPAGSWSVYALLALLAAIAISGVLASAGMHDLGPLAGAVGMHAADLALRWHEILAWAVLALAALHVLGVAWGSRVHRENLALAMVTGRKAIHDAAPEATAARAALAAGLAVLSLAFAGWYLASAAPRDIELRERSEQQARQALAASPWGAECASCHLAYAPALMPLRSWRRTLDEQDRHFGEDLALDEPAIEELMAAATAAAPSSWAAWKLRRTTPADASPLRISELPYWREAHDALGPEMFRPPASNGVHDCEACHRDAGSGIFHPRMIRMPKSKVVS
jgi:cytochrome b